MAIEKIIIWGDFSYISVIERAQYLEVKYLDHKPIPRSLVMNVREGRILDYLIS